METIDPAFVAGYANRRAPWGFSGLGEIVYLRTYSRFIDELGRKEMWHETLERAINGAQEVGAHYTQEEMQRLFDYMFNLKGAFSGRALWQLGTLLVQKFNAASLCNCLAGDTRVLTQEGAYPISELVGELSLMTEGGKWVKSEIKSFGKQRLMKIVLSRAKNIKEIYATPEHRWFVRGQDHREEYVTSELKPGQNLSYVFGQGIYSARPSAFGIAHGIVYGDGNRAHKGSMVVLCGEKDAQLLKYFPNSPTVQRDAGIGVVDLPAYFKDRPSLTESKSYLYGWLAGYFAADGSVSEGGQIRLNSARESDLEFVRDVCYILGIGTHPIHTQSRIGIGQTEPSDLHYLNFMPDMLNEDFFLIDSHRIRFTKTQSKKTWKVVSVEETDRFEEVYCAIVPETHSFVLEDNILTGNCYYTNIESIEDYEFLMDHLMLGGGVGFSVERARVHSFPKVKSDVKIVHERTNDADFIVPDSRQGWSALLHEVLKSYFYTGKSFTYSTLLVRGHGAPLKTFGGTASGPEVLVDGISEICSILAKRASKKMRSVDALDIANIVGKVVVAGSARRSAQIAVGDPDDFLFLRAKNWNSGSIPAYRGNSNNSIFADSYDEIVDELWKGYNGSGEPYGLINRSLASKEGRLGEYIKDDKIVGPNPCSEILLEDGESCNLAEIFLPNITSQEELEDLSKLLYKTQKAITSLDYPYEKTRKVVLRNRRLGQGVTGWMQASEEQVSWVSDTYDRLREFDTKWSLEMDISESIKLTAIKPSGTLSLLAGVTPGIHPAYARFYLRRVRIGAGDPIVDYCRQRGYPVQFDMGLDGKEDHRTVVVTFPCKSPENALLAKDTTAVRQLEWVVKAQTLWADNAVSVTVYYHKEELPEIQEWLKNNYEKKIKSVSFLLHSEHGFALAPYEEITEDEFNKLSAKIKNVELDESVLEDTSLAMLDVECAGGSCPVR